MKSTAPTITRVPNEYGNGVTIVVDDHRRDLSAQEREAAIKADRLSEKALLKRLDLTVDELNAAVALQLLPGPVAHGFSGRIFVSREVFYSATQIREYLVRHRSLLQKLADIDI
jgi:hypothetical protein